MRKLKSIIAILLSAVVIVTLVGCGCSEKSNTSDDQSTTSQTSSGDNQTSGTNSDSKSGTDFEPTTSLEQRKTVRAEDYINGKNFDLDGYAKALGYTKLNDPKGCVIYAIKRNETKCFVYITQQVIFVVFDQNDGYTYQADPLAIPMSEDSYLIDNGAKEGQQKANKLGFRYITNVMSHISTAEAIDFSHMPELESVFKLSGSPKYYPDGAPKEISKDVVETITIINND